MGKYEKPTLTEVHPEVVSIQVVAFECGACQREYNLELHNGDMRMVACPFCENASLQLVKGTE